MKVVLAVKEEDEGVLRVKLVEIGEVFADELVAVMGTWFECEEVFDWQTNCCWKWSKCWRPVVVIADEVEKAANALQQQRTNSRNKSSEKSDRSVLEVQGELGERRSRQQKTTTKFTQRKKTRLIDPARTGNVKNNNFHTIICSIRQPTDFFSRSCSSSMSNRERKIFRQDATSNKIITSNCPSTG